MLEPPTVCRHMWEGLPAAPISICAGCYLWFSLQEPWSIYIPINNTYCQYTCQAANTTLSFHYQQSSRDWSASFQCSWGLISYRSCRSAKPSSAWWQESQVQSASHPRSEKNAASVWVCRQSRVCEPIECWKCQTVMKTELSKLANAVKGSWDYSTNCKPVLGQSTNHQVNCQFGGI